MMLMLEILHDPMGTFLPSCALGFLVHKVMQDVFHQHAVN